jgi:hypothetical protein
VTETNFNASWDKGKFSVSASVKYDQAKGRVSIEATSEAISDNIAIVSSDAVGEIKVDPSKHGSARLDDPKTVHVRLENLPAHTGFGFVYDRPPQQIFVVDSQGNKIPVYTIGSDGVTVRRQN